MDNQRKTILYLLVIFVILSIVVGFLLFLYFSRKTQPSSQSSLSPTSNLLGKSFPNVEYKGIPIPYGYAAIKELGRATYTGVVENLILPNEASQNKMAKIILITPSPGFSLQQPKKDFFFNPNTTLFAINDPKDGGRITLDNDTQIEALGTVEWKKLSTRELTELLIKETIVSMQFIKINSNNLPSQEEIEASSPDLQVSIMVHSYLK